MTMEIDIGVWLTGFFTGFGLCAIVALIIYLLTDGKRGVA